MKQTPQPQKRVIIDYKNITPEILELLTQRFPYGYDSEDIIKFKNAAGDNVSALPIQTVDAYYLIKVSVEMDRKIENFLDDDDEDDRS